MLLHLFVSISVQKAKDSGDNVEQHRAGPNALYNGVFTVVKGLVNVEKEKLPNF